MNPWVDPRLKDVRPEQARAYMLAHGWKQKPFPRPQVWLFEGPLDDDGQPIPLVVPSEPVGSDYLQRIYELVTTLAILEDRLAVDVLNDMLASTNGQPPADGASRGRGAAART
jgi:hypothetical protein